MGLPIAEQQKTYPQCNERNIMTEDEIRKQIIEQLKIKDMYQDYNDRKDSINEEPISEEEKYKRHKKLYEEFQLKFI